MEKHTLSVLAKDHPGVLQRICSLFSRRGYNIDSISVGSSEEEGFSRMIIVVKGYSSIVEQIMKQLSKLMDVIKIEHLNKNPFLRRELMLIKCTLSPEVRHELLNLVDMFRFSVIDVGFESVTIQVVGDTDKNNAFLQLLQSYEIVEIARTGIIAMQRDLEKVPKQNTKRVNTNLKYEVYDR
jgi:acetolactate synthase I/III small subunit